MKQPSLIPYLQSDSGRFRLVIAPESSDAPSPFDPFPNPFGFKDISDRFAVLGKAGIAGDLAGQLLPLDMVIQRPAADGGSDRAIPPLTNLAVEEHWQKISANLCLPPLDALHFFLAEQIGEQERLRQFRPLFYCRAKQTYFHPPCPDCGQELKLCVDDALLSESGLPEYSTSPRRFLYCPECSSKRTPRKFYVPERIDTDTEIIYDINQLIRLWAHSAPAADGSSLLPCIGCPGHKTCYGPSMAALNALCSFSFYPFHLLLFRIDTGMRIDFMALLAGRKQPEQALPESKTDLADTPEADVISSEAAIHLILADIAAKWDMKEAGETSPSAEMPRAPIPPAPPTPTPSDIQASIPPDMMETVILDSRSMTEVKARIQPQVKQPVPGGMPPSPPEPEAAPYFNQTETLQLEETIIQPSGRPVESGNRLPPVAPSMGSLEETVVIPRPSGNRQNGGSGTPGAIPSSTQDPTGPKPSPEKTAGDDLAETIILQPRKKP